MPQPPASERRETRRRLVRYAAVAIITGGVVLRILQYAYGRSLWLDEASLALVIMESDGYGALLEPLGRNQVAPILFLWLQRAVIDLLGAGEYTLRLVPLLAGCASLPLFWPVFRRLAGPHAALAALAVCAGSAVAVYYSAENKQYALELLVLATVLWTYFELRGARRTWALAVVGAAGVFASHVAVVPLAVVGAHHIWSERFVPKAWIAPATWVLALAVFYLAFVHGHPTRETMETAWQDAFLPLGPAAGGWLRWAWAKALNLTGAQPAALPVFTGLAVLSLAQIVRRRAWTLAWVALAPLAIHLGLSVLRVYPVEQRLMLYLLPCLALLLTYGITSLAAEARPRVAVAAVLIFVVYFPAGAIGALPQQKEEFRYVRKGLERHYRPGQAVYLYYAAEPAWTFYEKTEAMSIDPPVVVGTRRTGDPGGYVRELAELEGEVWVALSHVPPMDERVILSILDHRGEWLFAIVARGSSAHLFHLPPEENP